MSLGIRVDVAASLPEGEGFGTNAISNEQTQSAPAFGGIPEDVRQAMGQACWPPSQGGIQQDFVVSDQSAKVMLDRAEALAEDAFAKASRPGATQADKLIAQEEMRAAEDLRSTASRGRSCEVKNQINELNSLEEDALHRVSRPHSGPLDRFVGSFEMFLGNQIEKQIDRELTRFLPMAKVR